MEIEMEETDNLKKIKYHTFNGNRYKIVVDKNLRTRGRCESPKVKNKTIRIKEGLRGESLLSTLVDEATHACEFDALANDFVDRLSDSISSFLTRAGYRLILKDTKN
jgi:hypothetical protein